MKHLSLPIHVEAPNGRPRRIQWNDRMVPVRHLVDFWVLQSRWWTRDERRVYFRIETPAGMFELYRSGERWMLAKMGD